MSRQRNWQLAQKADGNCTICGATAQGRTLCDTCAETKGVMRRKPLKSEWLGADWSAPNAVIAARLRVTEEAVSYQRRKHGKPASGTARGRTHPMPDGLRELMAAAAAAHEEHGGKLSPRPCDAGGTNLKSLALAAGVDRASVTRWLYGGQNPAPEYQDAVAAWCHRVITAAKKLTP